MERLKSLIRKTTYRTLDSLLEPTKGLGKDLFYLASMLSPQVCVEVFAFIGCTRGIVMVYRDDEFYGPGWHLPGGVIRSRENIATRIGKTLERETGITSHNAKILSCISLAESFDTSKPIRSHFLSIGMLVEVRKQEHLESYSASKQYVNGDCAVHYTLPQDIIKEHKKYISFINMILKGDPLLQYDILSDYYEGRW